MAYVLLIARAGHTKIAEFQGAVDAIVAVGSSVLGVVLNMIPQTRTGGEYGYRYGSSGYYGGTDHAKSGKYAPSQDPYAPRHE